MRPHSLGEEQWGCRRKEVPGHIRKPKHVFLSPFQGQPLPHPSSDNQAYLDVWALHGCDGQAYSSSSEHLRPQPQVQHDLQAGHLLQATFYTKGAPHSLHSGVPLPFRFSGNKGSSQVCSENRKAAPFPY